MWDMKEARDKKTLELEIKLGSSTIDLFIKRLRKWLGNGVRFRLEDKFSE